MANNDDYLDMKKARSKKNHFLPKSSTKNNFNFKLSGRRYANSTNKNHVVVKISGGARSELSLMSNFDYDTRENTLPIYDRTGLQIDLKDAKLEALSDFENTKVKENKENPTKRTYRLIFSMNGKTDPNKLLESVKETLQSQFKDNNFYYSLHDDTDNTHVHVTVMKKSLTQQKNLHLDKRKLNTLKKQFSISLVMRGIKAEFKSELEKQTDKQKEVNQQKNIINRELNNVYEVLDHGKGNFKFNKDSPQSYYLFLKTKNGKSKEMWNKGLETALKEANIKKGEFIKVKELKDENNQSFKTKQWQIEKVDMSKYKETLTINKIGEDNYQFRAKGKKSAFIECVTSHGEVKTLFDKALVEELKHKGVSKDDVITINLFNDKIILNGTEKALDKQTISKKDTGIEI